MHVPGVLGQQIVRREERRRGLLVEQSRDSRLGVGRMESDRDDQPLVELDACEGVSGAVAAQPTHVGRPVRVRDEETDAAVPELEQVRRGDSAAELVVDHDCIARHLGEPAIDLDDADPAPREQSSGLPIRRGDDHPRGAHGEERPRARELLLTIAVVRDENYLVVRLSKDLLDPRRETRVELVAELGDGDTDDSARPLFQRPRRGVWNVSEAFGHLEQPIADDRRDIATAAERPRSGRRRRARLAGEVGKRGRPHRAVGAHDARHSAHVRRRAA